MPLEVVLNGLKAQAHRRFIKTHLPLDGLRYDARIKYLYVARDARDVFMSLWNHYTGMNDEFFLLMNGLGRSRGRRAAPPARRDIHAFWRDWTTRGWFPWETDGWPYWSHLYNVQSWWDFRDAAEHPARPLQRPARGHRGRDPPHGGFLEIDVPERCWPGIVKAVSFEEMKRQGERYAPGGGAVLEGRRRDLPPQGHERPLARRPLRRRDGPLRRRLRAGAHRRTAASGWRTAGPSDRTPSSDRFRIVRAAVSRPRGSPRRDVPGRSGAPTGRCPARCRAPGDRPAWGWTGT